MPNLVNLHEVSAFAGVRTLLDSVSLGIGDGERVGVVGRNGAGKSTLVRILAGRQPPDAGRVTQTSGLRVGLLDQHESPAAVDSVTAAVLGERAEHEWAGDPRTRDILAGLLADVPYDAPPATLSGGEQRRVSLAALLVADPDLLILDEPTNHLDVEAIDWLARHVSTSRTALLVVTHDRWFLDAVCTRMWEVVEGTVEGYEGGYSAYVLAKAERSRLAAVRQARRANLLRKELAWLRRGPPARTSKPRFRIAEANALIADEPPARDSVALSRFATARLGKTVYELSRVSLRLGGRVLLDRVDWQLGPGDRVALVGVNGSGKTSLLRLLSGELAPSAGTVRVGATVRAAYLSQDLGELDGDARVLSAVEEVARVVDLGDRRQVSASALAERFGFGPDRQWTPVADLSGGERRRLALLRLLMAGPNVLLLDEPTNDLDVETLTVIEDFLDSWAGSLVVVSHDRYFCERVAETTVALLGNGSLGALPGGVEEYLQRRRVAPAAGSRPRAGDSRQLRRELGRLEREVDRLTRREQELHRALAEHASDYAALSPYDRELRVVHADRLQAEQRWLDVAEQVEAAGD